MKTCPYCGSQMSDEAIFCQNCGSRFDDPEVRQQYAYGPYDQQYPQPQQEPVSDGKATGALVCGIISLFVAGLILGIIAIVLASQSKKELGYELPQAKAGKICGIIALAFAGLAVILGVAFASLGIRFGLFSGLLDMLR